MQRGALQPLSNATHSEGLALSQSPNVRPFSEYPTQPIAVTKRTAAMPLTTQERKKLENLRRKYRIEFRGEVPNHQWPKGHRATFTAIHELGKTLFDTYAADLTLVESAPWKTEVKEQAKQLTDRAKRCVRRNEATWRFACEPYVLARLTAEVVCQACRKRIWRSEIEASRDGTSNTAEALRIRQKKRQPCRCPRDSRKQDTIEAVGLNQIFGHREDEYVHHEPSISQELPNKTKPDAIYGLRHTRNIENLLNDTARIGSTEESGDVLVHEVLGESPISDEGDQISFPFLLLEAKSAKAAESDWNSILLQSAFPVRTLLSVQKSLQDITGTSSKWKAGPLVWLLMNRGEDWRVCAASLFDDGVRKPGMRIFDLWGGSITSKNAALQLLLIVDHVFEWARDIYREDILNELRIIASGDNDCASLIHVDTDIHSTFSFLHPTLSSESDGGVADLYTLGMKAFQETDSSHGIVRHATFIESRYRCLYVTRDNVQTLLQSTQDQVTKTFIRQVLSLLAEDCVLLSRASLNIVENQWTGYSRIPRQYHLDHIKFYSIVAYASFLLPDWQQARELTIIAIAEDAFENLAAASKYNPRRSVAQPPTLIEECDSETIKNVIAKLRAGNGRQTLLAAVKRISLTIGGYGSDIRLEPNDGRSRHILQWVYNYFKKGRIEPQESFLHVSDCFDQSHLAHSTEPFYFGEDLNVSSNGCILVYAKGHNHDIGRARLSSVCVYVTDGLPEVPSRESLGMAIKNTFENYDVYHTSRMYRIPNIRQPRKKTEEERWNIEDSYGLFSEGFDFVDWTISLGCGPPVRQGSPRSTTGKWLFERQLYPWSEPGYINGNIHGRLFIIYKIVTREIRYWRSIAQERQGQGIDCCQICAGAEQVLDALCSQCELELEGGFFERWFRKALLGQSPIDHEPLITDSEGRWGAGYERFKLNGYDPGDTDLKFEENLSFYEDLDKDFDDMMQLQIETGKFMRIYRDFKWPGFKKRDEEADVSSRKRKRDSSVSGQENGSSPDAPSSDGSDSS